jgi:hypothetical protein
MRYPMNEFESTRVSRDSKGLPNHFCEYDAYLLEPVDFVNYEFSVMLKKTLPTEKGDYLLSMLRQDKSFVGSFELISKNNQFAGVAYRTESILECNEEFINKLCSFVNNVVYKRF